MIRSLGILKQPPVVLLREPAMQPPRHEIESPKVNFSGRARSLTSVATQESTNRAINEFEVKICRSIYW